MPKTAAKQLEDATKQLNKELTDRRAEVNQLERKHLQLTTANEGLQATNDKLTKKQTKLQQAVATGEATVAARRVEHDELLAKNDELDTRIADKTDELATIRADIASQKARTDRELADYAATKKLEIKQAILGTNEELVADRAELAVIQAQIDEKTNLLADLNQAAIDEQEALKAATAEKDAVIADNAQVKVDLQESIDILQEKYNKLGFDYDNAMITVKKATEEHEKFVEYERQARKKLETKDRQLQEKEAELGQQSAFLKNRRSNLAEL